MAFPDLAAESVGTSRGKKESTGMEAMEGGLTYVMSRSTTRKLVSKSATLTQRAPNSVLRAMDLVRERP